VFSQESNGENDFLIAQYRDRSILESVVNLSQECGVDRILLSHTLTERTMLELH